VRLAYHTGWRKGGILGLTWDKVDMRQRTISLDPGETKNEEAKNASMRDELFNEMQGVLSKGRLGCSPMSFTIPGGLSGSLKRHGTRLAKK
jgi:integrase